ncbi:MAG: DUF4444 domain-containing protein, partial [Pseudomonadota bacterium]
MPGWLVVGWCAPLVSATSASGINQENTSLCEKSCAEVAPTGLVESWARQTLYWINRWEDEGAEAVHTEWRGLAHGIGERHRQGRLDGTFLGIDEHFGMLLRDQTTTHLIPMTLLLEGKSP